MKKILFITSSSAYVWVQYAIEILGKDFICYSASSSYEAREYIAHGVDKVVMYPFYIGWTTGEFSDGVDLRNFAGYYFWKQYILPKNIPIIVVNLEIQHHSFMTNLSTTAWQNQNNVIFFTHDSSWAKAQALAALIKT